MTDDGSPLDGNAPTRVIEGGIFPTSPRASRREGMFSDTLAGILGFDPGYDLKSFREALSEQEELELSARELEQLEEVLDEKYVTEPRDDQSSDSDALIPFHPIVAKHIEPPETHEWDAWYRLLMTRESNELNVGLHEELVGKLNSIEPSNMFEKLFCSLIRTMAADVEEGSERNDPPEPRRPYIPALAESFQEDIRSWANVSSLTGSQRLLLLRDLLCFYYMMYIMQVARNISEEWDQYLADDPSSWTPEIKPIPFGVRTERASGDRDFRNIWDDMPSEQSLFDQLYYSWMRLSVLRILNDTIEQTEATVETTPATLLEAREALENETSHVDVAIRKLLDPVNEDRYQVAAEESEEAEISTDQDDEEASEQDGMEPDVTTLREASRILFYAIDDYYRERSSQNTAAVRLGPAAVEQLGISEERGFIERRNKAGTILVLNEGALTMMARLFTEREKNGNEDFSISNFYRFLTKRGIHFDETSEDAAETLLERIGLIQKESDSGDSTNVRTY
jgi:DNA phosphorothioation-dependent restriction protein DptG